MNAHLSFRRRYLTSTEIMRLREADYEYYESDEYLSQLFTDNEYLFNDKGEIDNE